MSGGCSCLRDRSTSGASAFSVPCELCSAAESKQVPGLSVGKGSRVVIFSFGFFIGGGDRGPHSAVLRVYLQFCAHGSFLEVLRGLLVRLETEPE